MANTAVKAKKQANPRGTTKRTRPKSRRGAPTEPTAAEVEARKVVARMFFDPTSAAAARAAFLKRQQPDADHAG